MNTRDSIRDENPQLHDYLRDHLTDIPDFYDVLEVADRWDDVNADSVVWNNVYLELENLGSYSDVVATLNGRRRALPIGLERLHEFIKIFPTVLWVTLLQSRHQRTVHTDF